MQFQPVWIAGRYNYGHPFAEDPAVHLPAVPQDLHRHKGTVYYRLRTGAETVVMVITLLAHGCPTQATVAAFGINERTVADGLARAGRQGQAVHEWLVEHLRDLGQVQADEIRVKKQGGIVWMALALMIRMRLWLAGEVSAHRDMTLIRRLIERVRRGAARPLLVCIDGLNAWVRAIRETCHDPVRTGTHGHPRLHAWKHICMAQGVKRYAQRRVVDVERRMVDGMPARVERLRHRSQGHGVIHTASLERLNATFRERLAALTRRGRALARRPLTRHHGMYLVGTVYNFCTPHKRLCQAGDATTPAMAAELTDHCWTVQEWWSFHVPPPPWTPPKRRGRPSRALHRLVERWCS